MGLDTESKLDISNKMAKTARKFINLYVAVDEKDRIIAFNKNYEVVYKKAIDFINWDKNAGFRIYQLHTPYTKQMIYCLLNYGWQIYKSLGCNNLFQILFLSFIYTSNKTSK